MAGIDRSPVNLALRFRVAVGVVLTFFFVLVLRLWYLQILKGEYFRVRSENNRLRTIYVQPPRGLILDREGRILVKNRPGFNVELISEDAPNPKETVTRLAGILGMQAAELLPKLHDQSKRRRYEPKLLLKDVSRDIVALVSSRRFGLPGVEINVTPTREYVYGSLASHVLGYIREITKEQLDSPMYAGYRNGEIVGQFGIEHKLERYLQGKRGVRRVIVNATGTRYGESSFDPEIAGHNVTLTIDLDVQRAADEAMQGKKGAVVAIVPNTGELLALTSKPDFDPNIFAGELTAEMWRSLGGKEKRLSNRAVQGVYPPGSVFKIFMAIAGLQEGVINKHERIYCPGYLSFAGRNYRCHKKNGHGAVNLYESLVLSCDVYYYTLGQRLGVDLIHHYSTMFGLGQLTKLDLVPESEGIIPSTEWKRRYFKNKEDQKWYPGETLSVAIGQGAVSVTPIQLARGLAAVVNGGRLLRPHLVKEIASNDDSFKDDDFGVIEDGVVKIKPSAIAEVRAGLKGVVNDPQGTGKRARLDKSFPVTVAGKTGTAQVVSLGLASLGEHLEDHAWFAGYAPEENPEILVVTLVENGGGGGANAAPVVRQVMEAYFKKKYPEAQLTPPPPGSPAAARVVQAAQPQTGGGSE
ncbi:MAG: penicillin-binding protein 2 [Deltaproteobacteria bacterium]|nr:penicillin-binding protein 2 [Deltaproteobacteria bacterium]